jgi:hypothetical protein
VKRFRRGWRANPHELFDPTRFRVNDIDCDGGYVADGQG